MSRKFVCMAGALVLGACTVTGSEDTVARGNAEMTGAELYAEHCSVCHGSTGLGDGPMAGNFRPRPADLTRISGPDDKFPHAQVRSQVHGYFRRNTTHPSMPEFAEVLDGPTIYYDSGDGIKTPTPRPLVAISEYLASIQQGGSR
ncbi:c-type cytochrome [Roseivivax sp. CAU 1761]